jgi:nucleotide-binding universal stress UspA family protein
MTDALVAHDRLVQASPLRLRSVKTDQALCFKHLLVPLDGSPFAEHALRYLCAITRATAPQVTLLHAVESPQRAGSRGIDPVEFEMVRADAQAYLASIAERLRAHDLVPRIVLLQGNAAEQVCSFARQHGVDLIIMSSRGASVPGPRGAHTDWVVGSTAQRIIASAPTSLLVLPQRATDAPARDEELRLRRMLLPLDLSARAEYILPTALALARRHDAELVLAHVVPEPEMPRRMGPSREDLTLLGQVVDRNRREASRYLREIKNRLATEYPRVDTRLIVAPKRAQTLRELAEREHIDLIILAAHGSTGDTQHRYGGVAAKFVLEGYGPVIILQDLAGLAARDAQATASQHDPRPAW